ncbi:MAG TPA: class I SAM-dependent methyltransferase [Alphaproteobacteria bacterium]|nr:class I SAM-dependent methyltransferase [Alphaproteobacteria bacterium]
MGVVMTVAVVSLSDGAQEPFPDADEDRALQALIRHVRGNRFIPEPPAELQHVGDGDFRAIGAEFLGHFVRLGGLRPNHAVLDIGCGIGRMALPLTQYLDPAAGRYEGVDVVAEGIAWCDRTITPVYPNFRFRHIDVVNSLYNPAGGAPAEALRLPFGDGSFDIAVLTSVFTHLVAAESAAMIGEIARTLRPGGRCFASLFLIDDRARAGLEAGAARLAFDLAGDGPDYFVDPTVPAGAVAYDADRFLELAEAGGLVPARPVAPGNWCGRPGLSFQDLLVLEKRAAR